MSWLKRPLLAVALTVLSACASPRPTPVAPLREAGLPPLRPASDLPGELVWRQKVSASWRDRARGMHLQNAQFEAVLQKRGAELLLLGLSPLGRPGFELRLRGRALSVENRTGQPLPFSPRHIIDDIQRAFFPWLDRETGGLDGNRRGFAHGWYVAELQRGGRLRARRFARGADRPVAVEVRYDGWTAPNAPPRHVVLVNHEHGYRIAVETLPAGSEAAAE